MPDTGRVLRTTINNDAAGSDELLPKGRAGDLSAPFAVVDVPLRLLAFGLADDDRVAVLRVWRPQSTGGFDACGRMLPGGEMFERPYRIGGRDIELSADVPEVLLDAAGWFRVVYRGRRRHDVQVSLLTDRVAHRDNTMRGIV